jgi:hypothetical protein
VGGGYNFGHYDAGSVYVTGDAVVVREGTFSPNIFDRNSFLKRVWHQAVYLNGVEVSASFSLAATTSGQKLWQLSADMPITTIDGANTVRIAKVAGALAANIESVWVRVRSSVLDL